MSNYVWKQVENIRRDIVDVLRDSGFDIMLTPRKLTINRGNEKIVEVNTKSTAPEELVSLANDSLYYRQQIAMMMTAMNAVIYLKGDIADAVKDKAHRAFGLYVNMRNYLREHPTARQMPVYSDSELIAVGYVFLNDAETEIIDSRAGKPSDTPKDAFPKESEVDNKHEEPKKVEITNATVNQHCKKVMATLEDVANEYNGVVYKLRYGNGPYKQANVPCLWFTVTYGYSTYNFKYTLPIRLWGLLQRHTETFVEEHGLDSKCIKQLNKTVLIRMGLDFLFSNITVVNEVTANVARDSIYKARKVIEGDIGMAYMPYGKYNTIFTHDVSSRHSVDIVNR